MITSKQKIIDVYLQLLKEKHHATLSVKEITDRASISRTTFYSHFPDKEAVLKEVRTRLYRTFLSFYGDGNQQAADSINELNAIVICEHIFKYRAFYEMTFQDALEIQKLSNLLADKLFDIYKDKDYAIFASYGTIGYLSIWVNEQFQLSPKEAGERMMKIGVTNWAIENFKQFQQ